MLAFSCSEQQGFYGRLMLMRTPRLSLAALTAAVIASGALSCLAADSNMIGNYDLGRKKSFSYEIDPERDPRLFIAVELVFKGALRGEPGTIAQFCLLVQKIVNDGGSAAAYAMDLGYIMTVRGDEDFAGEVHDIALSQKEKQRVWDYLTQSGSKSRYPATRKALLGK